MKKPFLRGGGGGTLLDTLSEKQSETLGEITLTRKDRFAPQDDMFLNGSSHFTPHSSLRKAGFTLAEVLITLGIIGIVAAMTMPAMIQNYKKKVYTSKLQQTYSLLNQGFRNYLAQEGVDRLSDTKAWQHLQSTNLDSCDPSNLGTEEVCMEWVKDMSAVFKGLQVQNKGVVTYKYLSNNGTGTRGPWSVALNNGAIFYIGIYKNYNTTPHKARVKQYGTKMETSVAYLDIDITGTSLPNQWGRDFFEFQVADNGFVYPEGGREYSVFRNGNFDSYWNSQYRSWGCNPKTQNKPYGYGCGARVLEEGKMDY